ncbi:MAG TPA: thioredoxin fold domain-containing protein [Nitrospiraceae bacterium]|nr:thioredoxin fold domain-containing protein [Nitrospiraceae bacterium]
MRTIFSLTLTCLAMIFTGEIRADEPPIKWRRNLYEAFLEANDSKKPLIVYFTQDNCKFCSQLERGVFNEPELKGFANEAVFVWANSKDEDDKGNYGQLRRDLRIDKFPSVVVLQTSPQGIREMGRIVGYFSLEDFVSHMREILGPPPASTAAVMPTL